jgi:hypothetical protein
VALWAAADGLAVEAVELYIWDRAGSDN